MHLLPASLLLHAVHGDCPCLHLREPELAGQLLRAEAAGSMCAHQCALQHPCGEVPISPPAPTQCVCGLGLRLFLATPHPQEVGLAGKLQSRAEKGRPQDTRNPSQCTWLLWLREEPCAGERGCCPVAWLPSGHGTQHGYSIGDQRLGFLSEIVPYGLFT